jgi:glycosyltransferase involved in cell wall biosynthesis
VINPEQYDLAIINTVVMGIESVPELHDRLPCVLWIHEGESMLWNSRVPLCDWKEAFSWTSHIVFQSAWQAERIWGSFTSGLPTNRYSVVPNCQPIELLDASLVRRPTPGKRRVIFLGSVYQRKRPHDLIDAVLSLKRDDVECLFIGPTDGLATLSSYHQSLLRSRSGLLLVGKVSRSEALAYLASADVLSLPSADESQPLVLLEAARFGIPVVISDLPVYQHCWTDGVNCLKHAVGDVETLARHLATCLDGKAPKPTLSADCNPSEGEFLAQFDSILARMLPAKVGASGLR